MTRLDRTFGSERRNRPDQVGAPVDIFLTPDAEIGLARQIYEQIRSGIIDGPLRTGDRLPSTRELAATLQVSRHTVTTAYGRLSAEGYLDGHRGGGTVVAATVGVRTTDAEPALVPTWVDRGDRRSITYDLRVGTPDPGLFPSTEWKRYARSAVDEHVVGYGDPAGSTDLRQVLARWIGRSRGVEANFRQLIVTRGAQQALYLIARLCAGSGAVVAVEDPGYLPFRRILEAIGATIAPVPVDDEGIVVDEIPGTARLVYVTPSHQFPTGVTMSMRRRKALLELAIQRDMVILEDDYDSEYRYVDRPLEPLFRLDRNGRVVYVASFSKTLSPALRLGFAVVPPWKWAEVVRLRQLIDWAPSGIDQLTLRGFVADGHLDRHLRRARRVYSVRHHRMADLLDGAAARGIVEPSVSHAGLHVAARLVDGLNESKIVEQLAGRGVAIEGYEPYSIAASDRSAGLVFGFGNIDADRLETAASIIEDVLFV